MPASQILLFDQPRSAAQLLRRILGKQPNLQILDNTFGPARGAQVEWLMGEAWADGISDDSWTAFNTAIEKGLSAWRSASQDCQNKGQILLLQNHPFALVSPETVLKVIQNPSPTESEILAASAAPAATSSDERGNRGPRAALLQEAVDNVTTIPNELLFAPGTVPVLTIRDPRLTVPSAHRVLGAMGLPHGSGRPNFLISTSTLWVRGAYEAYKARGLEPVVVDADDLMTGGPEFARRLCSRLGLDPERACLSWDVPTAEERAAMHPAYYASQKFLIESSGVDAGRAARNRDLEAEVAGWPAEFGEDVEMIREMVDLAMPHYRYLQERRFKM